MELGHLLKNYRFSIMVLLLSVSYMQDPLKADFNDQSILTQSELELLAARLCLILHNGRNNDTYSISNNLRSTLIKTANIQGSTKADMQKLAVWINKYSSGFICKSSSGLYARQHLFRRAVELSVHKETFQGFFAKDFDNFPIDFNVLEINGEGEFSNIIDYLNEIMAREDYRDKYNFGEIDRMYRILKVRFNTKGFNDLTGPEKVKYTTLYKEAAFKEQ